VTEFRVRTYGPADAATVAVIYVDAVTVLGHRGYSPAQVAAWASRARTPEDVVAWAGDGRLVLVAVDDNDTPIAFIDLEADGHIDMMFCTPQCSGRGVASALYGRLEAAARDGGLTRLHTEAREVARPIFARWGFRLLHRNDMEIDCVAIHNYLMEKTLRPATLTTGLADS